jgi:hypothetical protein
VSMRTGTLVLTESCVTCVIMPPHTGAQAHSARATLSPRVITTHRLPEARTSNAQVGLGYPQIAVCPHRHLCHRHRHHRRHHRHRMPPRHPHWGRQCALWPIAKRVWWALLRPAPRVVRGTTKPTCCPPLRVPTLHNVHPRRARSGNPVSRNAGRATRATRHPAWRVPLVTLCSWRGPILCVWQASVASEIAQPVICRPRTPAVSYVTCARSIL